MSKQFKINVILVAGMIFVILAMLNFSTMFFGYPVSTELVTSIMIGTAIYTWLLSIAELEKFEIERSERKGIDKKIDVKQDKKSAIIKNYLIIIFAVIVIVVSYYIIIIWDSEKMAGTISNSLSLLVFAYFIFKFLYVEDEKEHEIKKTFNIQTFLSIMSHLRLGIIIIAKGTFICIKWTLGKLFSKNFVRGVIILYILLDMVLLSEVLFFDYVVTSEVVKEEIVFGIANEEKISEAAKEEIIINDMLNKFAQLIITSSIGISAIAFYRSNERKFKKDEFINSIILIVVVSFALFLSQYINGSYTLKSMQISTLWSKKILMSLTVVYYLLILLSLVTKSPSKPK